MASASTTSDRASRPVATTNESASARRVTLPWPRIAIGLSAILLAISASFAWWSLTLHAPQYPDGLKITVSTTEVTGDVREVDGLNHYIGMMPLGEAAMIERKIAPYAIVAFVILGAIASGLKARRASLLALPIVAFPFVFAVDLYVWLYRAGHNLDPTAALSSSVKPFTPAMIGEGVVGQFSTTAMFQTGWFVAAAAALLAAFGIAATWRKRASDGGS